MLPAMTRKWTILPIIGWLSAYRLPWLRLDLVAGVTAAAVIIPQAMAYATIAGLPVEVGLYTALVPMVIYALLGTSRPLSVSTTSTIAILTAAQLAAAAPGGDQQQLLAATATLALLVGAFLLLAGILRLGFIANFISDPVLAGFKAGIGLVIIVGQLPKLLGMHVDKEPFFRYVLSIAAHVPEAGPMTAVLGLLTLAVLFALRRFLPRIPGPLVAVAAGIAASALLDLGGRGVGTIGEIPGGLPVPALPDVSLAWQLWPGALGIALMAFTESIAAGRAFARDSEPRVAANQELLALGVANIVGGLFKTMPAGGGTSQTAVNSRAGARSQMSGLVTAAAVLATLLFLAPLIALMPQATLAAVVVATTSGLLSPKDFRAILRIRRTEFWWAVAACAGVVLLGTLQGILVAIAISLLTLIHQANHPPLYALGRKRGTDVFRPLSEAHAGDETFPGLLMVRTEGRMTFASVPRIGEKMWSLIDEARPRVLALDMDAVPDIEYTALKMLAGFEEKLRQRGISLWLVALNPAALNVVERSPVGSTLGHERMFHNIEEAVAAYLASTPAAAVEPGRAMEGEKE
jgi:high affinity sulfate transporter 1